MTPKTRILMAGLVGAAAAVALSAPASASPAGTVHADATIHWNVVKGARSSGCYGAMDAKKSKGTWYVRGRFYRYPDASSCFYTLTRKSKHSTHIWSYRDNGKGVWVYGGWHKDSGYKAHVCAATDTLVTKCTKSW